MSEQITIDAEFLKGLTRSLDNYAEDLRYKFHGNDFETVNFSTSGTPSFSSEEDMMAYLDKIYEQVRDAKEILNPRDKVIRKLKERIQKTNTPETLHKLGLELASLFEEKESDR